MSKKRKLNHLDLDSSLASLPTHKRRRLNDHAMQMKSNANSSAMDTSKPRRKKKMNKKMVIKQFKVQPKLSSTFESDTVDKLMSAVTDIYAKRSAECSFEELYRSCHSLCTLNKGKLIYDKLFARCDAHLEQMIASVSSSLPNPGRHDRMVELDHSQVNLLPQLQSIWNNHRREMDAIRQVFLMLDRTYVRQETEVKSLWQMGIVLLKKHVLQRDANAFIQDNMMANLLRLVESERNGEEIDRELVKTMVMMVAHLGVYKSVFEKTLVGATNAYYEHEGHKLIETLTVPDYLKHVMKRLEDEHARCMHYLDHKTQRHLSIAIEQQMMHTHAQRILDKGLLGMCDELRIADLRHLYALLKSVQKLSPLKQAFYEYCTQRGLEIVNCNEQEQKQPEKQKQQQQQLLAMRTKHDKEMIPKLLAFKKNLDTIISQSFQGHSDFRPIIRKSWENFINQRQNKPAELMAKFVDNQLQTGARGTSEQELEETMARVMDIFRFVNGKDVFQAFYKKDLAKRLLLNTSASEDAEKSMINRIRKECGQSYAINLENMFKDIDISQDLNEKFRAHCNANGNSTDSNSSSCSSSEIAFNIHVLTSGCWPTYSTQPIALPPSIHSRMSKFSDFYAGVHNGRKLNWTAPLSHCIMAANFPKGRKELVLSAFQACVLMLFNQGNKFKFIELCEATKIDKSALRRTMLSLVKGNILLKKNKGMEFADDEEFKLNSKYENRLRRVKVNQIQIVETKQEIIKTSNKIYLDRQYQIDACVVRVMKARKALVHQQLMAECLKQLRFDAQPKQIKKRIEALIENDYLERDANNNTLYHYKA